MARYANARPWEEILEVAPDEPFRLKNLFNRATVGAIGDAVSMALPGFDRSSFMDLVFDFGWPGRELKQRIRHISTVLHELIPGDYREQLEVLLRAASATPAGFLALAYSDFVEAYGTDDWDASVPALAVFTRLESAEFAIRRFIAAHQDRTMAQLLAWAADPDPALRRLATEGCRPRLPWGIRLQTLVADPTPIVPILERLRDDPDKSVRRSVANNLNDISRDHPQLVIDLLRSWTPQPGTPLYQLARHALRTFLKQGNPDALRILRFAVEPSVALEALGLQPPQPSIGGSARLSFTIVSTKQEPQPVMVDYAVHYVKAAGGTSRKVFRLGSLVLQPGRPQTFSRELSFRQMTTRTHRPGKHRIDVLVSGAVVGSRSFELKPAAG